jgi:hypothetical protein
MWLDWRFDLTELLVGELLVGGVCVFGAGLLVGFLVAKYISISIMMDDWFFFTQRWPK